MKKIIIILVTVIVLITLIGVIVYKNLTGPVGDNIEEKEVVIPMGSSSSNIAKILKENSLIKSEFIFRIYVKLNNVSNFQAGTYYLKECMNLKEITEMLQTGIMFDPNQISITYVEGKNIRWLAKNIEKRTNNTEEEVYLLLENEEYINSLIEKYWFITDEIKSGDIYYSLEGYLFPDTYSIANKDVTLEDIFEKMLDRMEEKLEKYKEEIDNSNYSVHEILTIASIIELEGIEVEDRKNVSSVIYNRLKSNMSLGSDVTTYYAIKVDMGDRDLYQSEINEYNPYNTRGPDMEGKLPVSPVTSVSESSIEAAIKPNETDYLFFVADKNGKLYFTTTNGEHERIVDELINKGLWYEY